MSEKYFEKETIKDAFAKNVSHSICYKTLKGWLRKWAQVTGENEDCLCSYNICTNIAQTGVHLWIKGKNTDYYYIAPICIKCDNKEKRQKYFKMKPNLVYLKTNVNPNVHKGYIDKEDSDDSSDESDDSDSSNND